MAESQPSAPDTFRMLERLIKSIGGTTLMSTISDAHVSGYIAGRRKETRWGKKKFKDKRPMTLVSPATINREVAVLKRLFMRARRTWKILLANEPDWKSHRLSEANERVRELHQEEDAALFDAVRPDYQPWLEFALLTGMRLDETLIVWPEVNWFTRKIVTVGKGGKPVIVEMSDTVAELLESLRGHHHRYVFTYVAKRTSKKDDRVRGQRYPLTYEGCKTEWQRLRKRSGVSDLRFHDLRHDFATKLLRETGNLKLVSKALNHSDVSVTARYAHVIDSEIRDAMQAVANSRKKSRTKKSDAA
ncbi:tyrosine-type recombinase/integrase [Rhizobium leguminosarum]|uniref:tyrosine-type recombinase/integrase n=1 Tax=Rhizobium leguminosarum TaxID=384 RepID=UPI001C965F45|nr:site-specific integrase [Rhizobium leguminosarum]